MEETYPTDAIASFGESVGVTDLPKEVLEYVSNNLTYHISSIIQDARKFQTHGCRLTLSIEDIDRALKLKNIPPQYGFHSTESSTFRFASGGGREIYFEDTRDVDLQDVVYSNTQKVPSEPTIKAHWLAIDGIQPSVPENVVAPEKLAKPEGMDEAKTSSQSVISQVKVKPLAMHDLSVEQQIYYREVTEACMGTEDGRRAEALQSLSSDPGIHQLLPRLAVFVSEGVRINTVMHNLAILIYLMRMVSQLLKNTSVSLLKYLHEILPAVCTCIVSRRVCTKPETDNHWALRDFAGRQLGTICRVYSNDTNRIQPRILRLFCSALDEPQPHLATVYGICFSFIELGHEVVKTCLLPRVKRIANLIRMGSSGVDRDLADKNNAEHLRVLLTKGLSPFLKNFHTSAAEDRQDFYVSEYGSLGSQLFDEVTQHRRQTPHQARTPYQPAGHLRPGAVAIHRNPSSSPPLRTSHSVQQWQRSANVTSGASNASSTSSYRTGFQMRSTANYHIGGGSGAATQNPSSLSASQPRFVGIPPSTTNT